MSSTLSPTQSEFSTGRWSTEPVLDDTPRLPDLKSGRFPSKRPSLGKRASRALSRFVITFCVGIAATLAWQSYGDAARERIASSSEQLAWLAPQVAPAAQAAPRMIAPPGAASPDLEQLKAMSLGLAVVRQSVDQLTAQVAAGQEQMTRDITKLQAAEQDILHKISEPPPRPAAAAPVHKPVSLTPPPSAR
jgi:hypothetical protein